MAECGAHAALEQLQYKLPFNPSGCSCARPPAAPARLLSLTCCHALHLLRCSTPKRLTSVSLCFKPDSYELVDCPAAWKSECQGVR